MIPAWKYNFLLLSLTECLTAYLTQAILQAVEQNQQRIFHSSTSKIKICRANSRLYYDLVLYRFHAKESKNVDAGPRKITSFPCGTLMTLLNEWMTDSWKKIGSNRIHPTSAGSTAPQTTACGPSSLWRCERQSGPKNGANAPGQQTWCFSQVSEYALEGKKQNSFGHAWVAHCSNWKRFGNSAPCNEAWKPNAGKYVFDLQEMLGVTPLSCACATKGAAIHTYIHTFHLQRDR